MRKVFIMAILAAILAGLVLGACSLYFEYPTHGGGGGGGGGGRPRDAGPPGDAPDPFPPDAPYPLDATPPDDVPDPFPPDAPYPLDAAPIDSGAPDAPRY